LYRLNSYTRSLTTYSRLVTHQIKIGDITLGGKSPIRLQSMTTADTMNTIDTVAETIRIYEAGADFVRITAPSIKEAKHLAIIKAELKKQKLNIPLIADIHFTPNAAIEAAKIVEKVRINPGNYADKKKFQQIVYTDAEYADEIERIYERFAPLVKVCKTEGTAMRIGTNHGSLSDRIMSRYGDTALGMVESALELVRICEDLNYHDIVLSMKASNTQIMVQAYRLLVNKMMEEGNYVYPLHLGVTEAGEAEDGRIKSAVGIGTLLEDGIGDTVRVSLTEAPELEIPVCKKIVARYSNRENHKPITPIEVNPILPFQYQKRKSANVNNIGGKNVPVVVADLSAKPITSPIQLQNVGYIYDASLDKWKLSDQAADYVYTKVRLTFELPGTLKILLDAEVWQQNKDKNKSKQTGELKYYPVINEHALSNYNFDDVMHFIITKNDILQNGLAQHLSKNKKAILIIQTENKHRMPALRRLMIDLINKKIDCPVILNCNFTTNNTEQLMVDSGTDFGGLFIDGLGDGIWMTAPNHVPQLINETSFYILQATRTRISKTEYISCPSCGRTLFDLQETTAMIRAKTHHLKGVKIGIMGCIVNGPGEMADADYGYVGSGVGKITLYKGQEVIKKNIAAEGALNALVDLIKANGDWIEMN